MATIHDTTPTSALKRQIQLFQTMFNGLENETLEKLRAVAHSRKYAAKEVICRQGEQGEQFYAVIKGRVAVTQEQEDGSEQILGVCGPGKYFGEMSLLDDTPRIATCTTMVASTILEISKAEFGQLVKTSPAIAYSLMYNILENLRINDARSIERLMAINEELTRAYTDLEEVQKTLIQHERLKHEMGLAADVQKQLLPVQLPAVAGYQFATFHNAAAQTSGDFYALMPLTEGRIGLLLVDIHRRGIEAALFMGVLRALFLAESRHTAAPEVVMERVNRHVWQLMAEDSPTASVFYGVLDTASGQLVYVLAQHVSSYRVTVAEEVEILPGNSPPLGSPSETTFSAESVQLQPGERLLVLSQSLIEAEIAPGQASFARQLRGLLQSSPRATAAETLQRLAAYIHEWLADDVQHDDQTALVVAVETL